MAADAWAEFCPEQELERLECIELDLDEHVDSVPDFAFNREQNATIENNVLCRQDNLALLQTLNETSVPCTRQGSGA